MTEGIAIENPYGMGAVETQSPLSQFLDHLGVTPIASIFLVLYVAAIGIAIWRGWPLRMGLLMLVLAWPPLVWVAQHTDAEPMAALAGAFAVPLLLIIVGSVTGSGRAIRQYRQERRRGFHSFD